MPRKNPTSVTLNESVQKIKDELAPVYGLKNILSAGLILFDKLSSDKQKAIIADSKTKKIKTGPKSLQQTIDMIKEMVEVEKQQPGTIFRVLGPDEQKIVQDFVKAVGPELIKKKAKKRG